MNEQRSKVRAYGPSELRGLADQLSGNQPDVADAVEATADEIERLTRFGWQPIETAPHETNVLLYSPPAPPSFRPVIEVGTATRGRRAHGVSNISAHAYATHWMPLPLPPSAQQEEGK
jgi:hypothetical protein